MRLREKAREEGRDFRFLLMCASCDQQWICAQVNWSSFYKINSTVRSGGLGLGRGEVSIAGEESSPRASQVKYRRDVTMLILHGKSAEVSFEFRSSQSEAGLMILPICCFLSNRLTFQSVRKQLTYFLPFIVYRFIPDLTFSSVSQEIMSGSRIFFFNLATGDFWACVYEHYWKYSHLLKG